MSPRAKSALATPVWLLVAGCSALFDYPDVGKEESRAACANGIDDDLDGKKDCSDRGCAAYCVETDEATCSDTKDNDGDGKFDCDDEDCRIVCQRDESSVAACTDSLDNDLDGFTDCDDSSCIGFCPEDNADACSDHADNDGDGRTDCEAESCDGFCPENTADACDDQRDNDRDGSTDCEAVSCDGFCPESTADTCNDHRDNDGDGSTDCEAESCNGFCPEVESGPCSDGWDNDGDGLTDASDPLCWPFSPLAVRRCATTAGQKIAELFDLGGPSHTFGPNVSFEARQPALTDRSDGVLSLFGSTASGSLESGNLSGIVVDRLLSGSWDGLELSFAAQVFAHTKLQVALLPVDLAPDGRAPIAGPESALIAVTLDGSVNPAVLALDVEGRRATRALPLLSTCSGGYCGDGWVRVTVTLEDENVVATVSVPNADDRTTDTPLTTTAPTSAELPASRLVVWGGSTDAAVGARLDDLSLRHAARSPCGSAVPQIPAPTSVCASADSEPGSMGRTVSVAHSAGDGALCALVSAGPQATGDPVSVLAWRSDDGTAWRSGRRASSPNQVPVPEGKPVVGAGVARDDDDDQWLAAVAYREPSGVQLAFSSSDDCVSWEALMEGPLLPADAEAPSYVYTGREHQIYFTRPPAGDALRTLWRASGATQADIAVEDLPLFELPVEARATAPVAIQRVGATDLVMTYPTLALEGPIGGGVFVGDSSGRTFRSLPSDLIEVPGSLGTSFDRDGVAAIALGWWARDGAEPDSVDATRGAGLLLYGGIRSETLSSGETGVRIATGTALVGLEGDRLLSDPAPPEARCGDDDCSDNENCQSCPEDCACPGVVLVDEALGDASAWETVLDTPPSFAYIDEQNGLLNMLPGDQYAVLAMQELDREAVGDFELSFDLFALGSCGSLSVGLWDPVDDVPGGVFAQVTNCSAGVLEVEPLSWPVTGELEPKTECRGVGVYPAPGDNALRVVLRKQGDQLSAGVAGEGECNEPVTVEARSSSGKAGEIAVLALPRECQDATPSSIGHFRLRLLDDPDDCPTSETRCERDGAAACVDTDRTPEHCGGCFSPCDAPAVCGGGTCACPTGLEDCAGTASTRPECYDLDRSIDHCGACGEACFATCVAGECVGQSCANAAPIPAEGGTFQFRFDPTRPLDPNDASPCEAQMSGETAFAWTPASAGTARITIQSDFFAALGVTSNAGCGSYEQCDLGSGEGVAEVVLPVAAGTTYRIVAVNPNSAATLSQLIVELDP